MKKIYFLLLCFLTSLSFGQDLKITGVVDADLTGGLPKAVEFYVINDIADLSVYGFGSANNGGGSDGEEFTFPNVLATAGQFIYVASEATSFSTYFGFAPDYTSGAANINGDDAIELFKDGIVVDVFGEINVDGTGQPWEYLDGWAYRNNGTGPDGTTFIPSNWTFSGPNALDGAATNASAATPFPVGTYDGGGGVIVIGNPIAFDATALSISEIGLGWTLNSNSDAVIIAFTQNEAVAGNPEDGTTYTAGDVLTGGGTIIYAGNATTFDHTGLDENSPYHYKIWSVDTDTNYSAGVAGNASTLSSVPPAPSDLILTGVVDGGLSGGLPKAVEFYAMNDIADLSIYGFGSANNGGGSDAEEFTFPAGSASAGDFIYVASESSQFTAFFGFAPNYTSGAANINGDDAIELFKDGGGVDVFGEIDVDGSGQPWEYMDGWAYRKDFTGPDGSTFMLANWSFSAPNALDGETTNDNAATPFPIGTYGQPALILTGIIDGPLSGGTPKAVEFYMLKDVADLSIYGFGSANNGGGTDGEEFTFPAVTASAGDFIYVASEIPQFTAFFGFAPHYTSSAANNNGDDAIELFMNGAVVDTYGEINVDGTNQPWEYMDGWAYRKNGKGPDGTTFQLDNWTFSGPNALDNETTNATAAMPFPLGTYDRKADIVLPGLITILEARGADKIDQLVTVSGVITVADQFSGSAYIQDATGAIAVFDELVHGDGVFMVGDAITLTGKRSVFNDQVQISEVLAVENNGIPNNPIVPLTITLSEMAAHPAELVRIADPVFPSPGNLLFAESNYILTDASGSGELRIDGDVADIVGLGQPETCAELIGVVGRYFELFQLLPRFKSDMACADPYEPTGSDLAISNDKTFDLVTWNIEWFGDEANSPPAVNPDSDQIQKESVKEVIAKLNADIYAVQEISDDALFQQMVSELPGYDYVLSEATSYPNDTEGTKQKIGFIYNTSTVEMVNTKVLLQTIHPYYNGGDESALTDFPDADKTRFYASGRLPFMLTANVTIDGNTQQVNIIDLHARANSSDGAQSRYDMRKYDVEMLKDSLDFFYPDANLILLGDYNDDVDETVADGINTTISSYQAYVGDASNYNIVTSVLSAGGYRSYVFRENMIDHITVSNELAANYIEESARVHYEFYDSDYSRTASDHFPVSARLQLKLLTLDESHYTDVSCYGASDGTATVSISGGISPYTYVWSGSDATTNTTTGLDEGMYTVTVTDALGSMLTQEFVILEPTPLEVITTEDANVYLGYPAASCTTLSVTEISGGTAPYTIEWNTGETTEAVNVCPEETTTYTVTVTDANGCTNEQAIVVTVIDVQCGNNSNNPKVEICHNGKTICVSQQAVQAHLNHGDTLGSCDMTNEVSISKMTAYPNPFSNFVDVNFDTSTDAEVKIEIYDFNGFLVVNYNKNALRGQSHISLKLDHLRKGFYFLKMSINGEIKTIRTLMKH
jgi:endonuclease/exonuclease/phosphatase family metal-dependent hydrolase